jgi:hypothetical protein
MTFIFYYTELIGGNKYKETIEAENFRSARNEFFNTHQTPHKIDAIWNITTNERLM